MSAANTLRVNTDAKSSRRTSSNQCGNAVVSYGSVSDGMVDRPKLAAEVDLPPVEDATPQMRQGLALLLEGWMCADALTRDTWDFAVELQCLREVGLTNNALRWMICQGWLEQARELPPSSKAGRHFRANSGLTFTARTCFVLTDVGVSVAERVCEMVHPDSWPQGLSSSTYEPSAADPKKNDGSMVHPRWDPERHHLYLDGVLVKEYKLPSPNQGTILMAFEEEGWPPRIDDPLPPTPDVDSKARLRYTIKALNKKQKQRLIRFMGDGTGQGVRWELFD